jgi:L-ribulose-5-phosphate 3-epimerase
MDLCISYWSIKGGLENERPVEEAILEAKSAGFDGLELAIGTSGVITPETDQKTMKSYRALGEKHGIKLETFACALTWQYSPTHPDPEIRRKAIQVHAAALQRAAWLGAKAMLMIPGAVKIPWDESYQPVRYDAAVNWAREAVLELVEVAQRVGVDLCVENVWNGMFYSPLEFTQFIDSIGTTDHLGVYFDVGNVLGYHQYPPHWIELLGKRILRVHIKDFKNSVGNITGFCDLLAGDVPWKESMAALRKIGYDKTLIAEMMPPDPTLLSRTHEAMVKIVQM